MKVLNNKKVIRYLGHLFLKKTQVHHASVGMRFKRSTVSHIGDIPHSTQLHMVEWKVVKMLKPRVLTRESGPRIRDLPYSYRAISLVLWWLSISLLRTATYSTYLMDNPQSPEQHHQIILIS